MTNRVWSKSSPAPQQSCSAANLRARRRLGRVVDHGSRHRLHTGTVNRVAIDYARQGGLVTISAHLPNPANPDAGFNMTVFAL